MGKFKNVPSKFDIIDNNVTHAMSQGQNPGEYLESELRRIKGLLKELEQRKKTGKWTEEWGEKAMKGLQEQLDLINAKLSDIKYGTRNMELLRREEEVARINSEIKYVSLPRKVILNGRLKKLKGEIQKIRFDNKEIRRQMHMLGFDKPEALQGVKFEQQDETEIHL